MILNYLAVVPLVVFCVSSILLLFYLTWMLAERVHTVEKLIASGDIEGIMKLTLYSEEDEQ